MELLFPILIFGLMYLLLIRPQQQRVRAQRALVAALSVGDDVVTIGGLFGRIVAIQGDVVSLEVTPGVVLRVRRFAISGRADPAAESADGNDDQEEEA